MGSRSVRNFRLNRISGASQAIIAGVVVGALVLSGGAIAQAASQTVAAAPAAASDASLSELPPVGSVTVLEPLDFNAGSAPSPAGIQAALAQPLSDKAIGSQVGVSVYDVGAGREVYGKDAATPFMPASVTKILTATTALTAYGDDHRLITRVVRGPGQNSLTIVGAGNPLLIDGSGSQPSRYGQTLTQLATRTAVAIKTGGGTLPKFKISYDNSLYSGPQASPKWEKNYVPDGVVAKISALSSRASEDVLAGPPRAAVETAKKFASLLKQQGVPVTAGVGRVTTKQNQELVASVESAPMSTLVGQMLEDSDNTTAENLAHLAGAKLANSGSFAGGVEATQQVLGQLGADTSGLTLYDGSGLSRQDRITPDTLSQVLTLTALNKNSAIWAVGSGLPVAGFTGTLVNRFALETTRPGRGVVRGKTGALAGTITLAGLVTAKSGRLLAYTFMADKVKDADKTRLAWDVAATNLSECGC